MTYGILRDELSLPTCLIVAGWLYDYDEVGASFVSSSNGADAIQICDDTNVHLPPFSDLRVTVMRLF